MPDDHESSETVVDESVEHHTDTVPAPDIPEPKPEIQEHHVRQTTNPESSQRNEPVNFEPSAYSHDDSTASKMAQATHEDWVKPRKHEEEPSTETPRAKPITEDTTHASRMANEEDWSTAYGHKTQRTSDHEPFARKKNVTEIPEPERKSSFRADPRTEGTPIDSPLFKERTTESILTKIAEAPRRAAEKAEEIGYSVTKKYHNAREVPAENAARETYEKHMQENDIKFHKGEISSTMHKARQLKYAEEFKESSKPIEQRVAKNSVAAGNTFVHGLQLVKKQVQEDYRSSPAPKIKPSQGIVWSQAGKIGVVPIKTATRKGKQVGAAQPVRINFGGAWGSGNTGAYASPINFSGMFSKETPAEEKKRKPRK